MIKGLRITGYVLVKDELSDIGITGDKKPYRRNGCGKDAPNDERDNKPFPFSLNEEIDKYDTYRDNKACRAFCKDRKRSGDKGKYKQEPPVLCDGNIIKKDREPYKKGKGHIHYGFPGI